MNFPSGLPTPRIDYSYETEPSVITNKMESGTTRQRQRFTSSRNVAQALFTFSKYELSIFEAFLRYDLHSGASAFDMLLPQANKTTVVPTTVRILGGIYTAKAVAADMVWEIKCTLVIDDPKIMDESDYDFIKNYTEEELLLFMSLSDRLYHITNNLNLN